ncbi:hypothetical protein [Paenarthrobacter nitroguajacolicus]|uniref:hypothetical protein n=1 Tax=Paenarthrobacter nitroguajacolicus TaxID=211146 RepID=UPI0015B98CF9|nr:hypothetical protein [Paenarthrobacter nitroguajacolicus]NWL34250.1 hypothetical protein [Paenarthrobacter nitroguajacolicus]
MGAVVRDDLVLSRAVVTADVSAPLAHVNIEQWLKTQQALEYQQRAAGHNKNAGYSEAMSINSEVIGKGIVSERYRMEVGTPHYCKMVSVPDAFPSSSGRATTQVIWELSIEQLKGDELRYTNTVTSHPTDDFLTIIFGSGQTFEDVAAARQRALGERCLLETPYYAQCIAAFASDRESRGVS